MTMVPRPFETMEGEGYPVARQVSVFLENRVGQLLRMGQVLESEDVRILALSVIDSADYAVVRMLIDLPDKAVAALKEAGFAVTVSELVVVRLPHGKRGMLTVWSALLSSEINIAYAYPLLPTALGSAIALRVDNVGIAIDTLKQHKFVVLSELDLAGES